MYILSSGSPAWQLLLTLWARHTFAKPLHFSYIFGVILLTFLPQNMSVLCRIYCTIHLLYPNELVEPAAEKHPTALTQYMLLPGFKLGMQSFNEYVAFGLRQIFHWEKWACSSLKLQYRPWTAIIPHTDSRI